MAGAFISQPVGNTFYRYIFMESILLTKSIDGKFDVVLDCSYSCRNNAGHVQ